VSEFLEKLRGLVRLDGWQNALTGLGIYGRDRGMSHEPGGVVTLTDAALEALYYGEGIPARIVNLPVDDAMRLGYRHVPPEPDEDAVKRVDEEWKRLGCWGALSRAWKWGRLYGDGAVLLGVDDLGTTEDQIDLERVRGLRWVLDLDRRDYSPAGWYSDEAEPEYGEPSVYQITTTFGQTAITRRVHETRMIRFGGADTSRRRWQEIGYHDYSVLQRPYDALRRFDSDWQSASAMMADASVGVLKIPGFLDLIAGGQKDTFSTRMALVNLGLASARIFPIDKEEDFSRIERTFSGVADMLDKTTLYLSACIGWPVTVLFGRSPSGMDATGESDQENWRALVRSEQTDCLIPAAERLQSVVVASLGIDPTGWTIELPPLKDESPTDRATRRKLIADTDAVYVQQGVFTADEIALSRVQDGEWTDDPPIMDEDARAAREAQIEADYDRMTTGVPDEEPAAEPMSAAAPESAPGPAEPDQDEEEQPDDEEA